jgi:RNA polymerase sigma factor (sigma-70 family)
MTREEYGAAYQKGYNLTVRFLVSRGLSYDSAQETAQAAWAKGWERLGQLRDSNMVLTWMNSIALNIHRSFIRREPLLQTLPELSTPPKINLAAIDVRRILKCCKTNDRMVLQRHYLEGYKVQEIANSQGWTETAVRIRLLRARRSVGKRLGRRVEPSPASVGRRRAAAAALAQA